MLPDWPRAWGEPVASARLRITNADFQVEELFPLEASGDGEFDWLWVEKSGDSTEYVAKCLARLAGLPARAVTYAGLKDRHALTRQWFCLHRPGKAPLDWSPDEDAGWRVLAAYRHRQKLRRGIHRGNRFTLRLGDVQGVGALIEQRLEALRAGFPNYFGEQRFGHQGNNIERARQWLAGGSRPGRFEKGLYLSSARSYLFNEVMARRIEAQSWASAVDGDVFTLRDSGSIFHEEIDGEITRRIAQGDIHPTGPLFGNAGKISVSGRAAELEREVFDLEPQLCEGLLREGLKMERRPLRVVPGDLQWWWEPGPVLALSFSLPRGCFATALVRELVNYQENNR